MSKSVYNLIKAELDRRQKNAWDSLTKRKEEVYSKIPGLKELNNQIHAIGIYKSRAILSGETSNLSISSEAKKLNKQKNDLLEAAGYPSDYLDIKYRCNTCNDTGFISSSNNIIECSCYKQLLINNLYDQFNLRLTQFENFNVFDLNLYSLESNPQKYGSDISPRDNMISIKDKALTFIRNFPNPDQKNLFFCGPTGVGKTFMANCIAKELVEKGYTVLYSNSSSMFNLVNEYKLKGFKDNQSVNQSYNYKNILTVNLLIIDDLGTEPMSSSKYAELLNILDARRVNNLSKPPCKIIISTNLGLKEIKDFYTERVLSRIVQGFDLQRFWGEDIRKKK